MKPRFAEHLENDLVFSQYLEQTAFTVPLVKMTLLKKLSK